MGVTLPSRAGCQTAAMSGAQLISSVGVVGLGTMGAGIAEVAARHGFAVTAVEATSDALERGRGAITSSTARAVTREKMTETERDSVLSAITFTTNMHDLAAVDLVVEAVPEDLEMKRQVFRELDAIVRPEAILASNTSSLSITEISVATKRPSQVVGLHFFNPAPVQRFVEVVRTVVSSSETIDATVAFAEALGKESVVVGDKAGFIANALLFGYLNHAVALYEQRYASREDIDAAMRFGCGYPMGPLALLDLIGLDTAYEILDSMYHQGRDRLHAPRPLLKQMVTAGLLGRKNGRGFYTYEAANSSVVIDDGDAQAADPAPAHGITSVAVIGSGTMATGIMEVFARAGIPVTFVARSAEKVGAVQAAIEKSQAKAVERGKTDAATAAQVQGRIRGVTEASEIGQVDLVVEAVVEDLDVKLELFRTLDDVLPPDVILATTTSSLPIIELAAATSRPAQVIGLHFFNPAQVMKLVEVVDTVSTDEDLVNRMVQLVRDLGKHPVRCGDRAGFIVNALLFPYLNDAVAMLEANYASLDDMDVAMKYGCGLPMGPFELLDVVGLDVSLAIQQTLYREFREPGFAPAPLLEHLVTAGYLGRKTGRGFRVWT
jgi:3-hydroxybutyryl-CoA dehydrogenase